MENNTISTGNCGEYFVAAELERRGYTVAIPMSNVEDFDILAINRKTHKQIAVQIKTNKTEKKVWMLKKRNEELVGDNVYYVFVILNGLNNPEYHIVPSTIVSNSIKEQYIKWLEAPGRNGQKHNESSIRKFDDVYDLYLDNWEAFEK